eukprot:30886-Pelagococcus_subviridis.AAC.20
MSGNGVHHANGVVWEPVYRTRLRRQPQHHERRIVRERVPKALVLRDRVPQEHRVRDRVVGGQQSTVLRREAVRVDRGGASGDRPGRSQRVGGAIERRPRQPEQRGEAAIEAVNASQDAAAAARNRPRCGAEAREVPRVVAVEPAGDARG